MGYVNGSLENDKAADELSSSVATLDVDKVQKLLENGYNPNSIRTPGGRMF